MYCTVNDISDDVTAATLVELTDDADAGAVDTALVETKILEQSNIIDSFLRGRYALPITDANDLSQLKSICVSLTVCDLFQRRIGLDYPVSLSERRNAALKFLQQIQSGVMALNSGSGTSADSRFYKVNSKTKLFTNDDLAAF